MKTTDLISVLTKSLSENGDLEVEGTCFSKTYEIGPVVSVRASEDRLGENTVYLEIL